MAADSEKRRISILLAILGLLTLLLLFRYGWIMLGNKESLDPVNAPLVQIERGSIMDRNGRILAIQTQLYSVSAWIPRIENPEETSIILAEILKLDQKNLYVEFKNPDRSRFMYILRKITPSQTEEIKKRQEEGKLKGITLSPEPGRSYPEKNLLSHIVGYVGLDNVGLDGLEYTFNHVLAPPLSGAPHTTVFGNQIFLTVDLNTQYMIRQIAQKAFLKNNPDAIMVLVMDAKSGELLGYVSLPDYDPNRYQDYSIQERQDRPAVLTYEPGSVFKIFSVASILELGGITTGQTFDTTGGYNPEIFQKYNIPPITDLGRYGVLDTTNILVHSSNVGSAMASDTVEADDFYRKLREFGFGKQTGIPLPGESNGILKEPSRWSVRSKPTIAIGQEIGVSAIQVITAATVFTNGGILLKPRIVKKIVSPEGQILKEYKREPLQPVISPDHAREILLMMEQVVSADGGTVRRAHIPGLRISAKSGTAQVTDPSTGNYSTEKFVASVLGIFPTEDPQLIVYVVFATPKGDSYYGGRIAAPVLKELIEALAPYYHIPLLGNTELSHSGKVRISPQPVLSDVSCVPDFIGLPKRTALGWFKESGAFMEINGEGWVTRQNPPPGTPVTPGMTVFLELE